MVFAICFAFSSMMYSFSDDTKFFSRLLASLGCLAVYAIISKLEDINNSQNERRI